MNISFKNTPNLKRGNKIHIKESNKGLFTEYCGGEVTKKCIEKGKKSKNPIVRKRATFADNARKWSKKKQDGGPLSVVHSMPFDYEKTNKGLMEAYLKKEEHSIAEKEAEQKEKMEKAIEVGSRFGDLFNTVANFMDHAKIMKDSKQIEKQASKLIPKQNEYLENQFKLNDIKTMSDNIKIDKVPGLDVKNINLLK